MALLILDDAVHREARSHSEIQPIVPLPERSGRGGKALFSCDHQVFFVVSQVSLLARSQLRHVLEDKLPLVIGNGAADVALAVVVSSNDIEGDFGAADADIVTTEA